MFNSPVIKCILHPYLLKEYLGRWYCLGYREDNGEIWPMAVDRMIAESLAPAMVPFIDFPVKGISQEKYFDNIIGVTKEYNANTAKDYLLTKEEHKVVLGIFSNSPTFSSKAAFTLSLPSCSMNWFSPPNSAVIAPMYCVTSPRPNAPP